MKRVLLERVSPSPGGLLWVARRAPRRVVVGRRGTRIASLRRHARHSTAHRSRRPGRGRHVLVVLALAVSLIGGCATPAATLAPTVTGLGNGWTPDHSLELQYATKFSVDFYDGDQAPCPDRE
ncbi:MAG: hypothetical protein VB093_08600, partial [Propionicimonas sp.]|nr:hypothetical protein [Propionicimonas sp.]